MIHFSIKPITSDRTAKTCDCCTEYQERNLRMGFSASWLCSTKHRLRNEASLQNAMTCLKHCTVLTLHVIQNKIVV